MPRPDVSTHLREANLGTAWPAGRHLVEVEATDRYGSTFTVFQVMRVEEE